MRILFYQPSYTGHHFAYLARMLPGFTELPVEIVLATTAEALQSKEFARTLAPFADRIQCVACSTLPPQQPLANARHRLRELKEAIRALQPDHVMVCYADGIWDIAALETIAGRRPWPRELAVEGWIYRGRFGDLADRRWKSAARRWLFRRLLQQGLFRRLHLDHELLYNFAKQHAGKTATEIVLTPNPILLAPQISRETARQQLGLSPIRGPLVSLSGVIAPYKGAHVLLEAYRQCRGILTDPPIHLLLAGPHHEAIRTILGQSPYREWLHDGSIVSIDRFITEMEMFAAAAAAELVVAPYHHEGRSSIILWAAAAGRPSLGSDKGCVGFVVRQNKLGKTCDVADPPELASALLDGLNLKWTESDAQRVRGYAEFHRIENYQAVASELVRTRLGLSAAAND